MKINIKMSFQQYSLSQSIIKASCDYIKELHKKELLILFVLIMAQAIEEAGAQCGRTIIKIKIKKTTVFQQ